MVNAVFCCSGLPPCKFVFALKVAFVSLFCVERKIATQVHDLVSRNMGKKLSELGDFEIEVAVAKSALS